ncbi:tRNA pseudouridine synthase A-like [Phoenix dactylifera]|uniref:tRNA pseudouridine synthase A-like n=1 Tax=Phoenix dactylifera TaxID=42345 RepID=A0A8B7D4J1_PHODC|nr:tRNA pseudouridine synthase A-like [Phoenix dactylifera]
MSSSSATASDADEGPAAAAAADPAAAPRRRYKRRKVAIFLGYCGAGYQGMQKNPGARTIEGDLEEALFLAGAVPDADRGLPRRYDWARAARTDKGVSAAAQVVSGRFYVDPPGLVARLNSHLPDQIRIFGFKRVTNSFNAKKFCDRRRYVYLLPVFALDPSAHPDREAVMASLGSGNELDRCLECSERGRKVPGLMGREPRTSGGEERNDLGSGGVGGEDDSASNLKSETRVSAGFISEGSNKAGNGEFESNKVEKSELGSSTVGGEHGGASSLNVEGENDEAKNGEIESGKDVGSAANSILDSVVDSGVSKVEECSKLGNVDFVVEAKPIVETVVSMQEKRVETGVDDNTNGEQMAGRKSGFSYGDEERERFNRISKHYVGTHNFHNFTTRTKAEDPSARRYIISFNADRIVSIEGIEFVRCEVVGQSFMLHQIRKMIGLAVALMRNCAPESLMDIALRKEVNINVPTAPEVGLYLDEGLFTSYNQKWKDSHEELSMEAYAEEAEEFKMKYIYSHIASMEHKEGAVALWLHSLNRRNYPDFHFLETNKEHVDAEQTQVTQAENLRE